MTVSAGAVGGRSQLGDLLSRTLPFSGWEEGDLGFWDNRTTMHYAIHDYGSAHRVIQRVTIRGDRPY